MDIRFDHPAKLADALKAGELDLAFIPSIEYLLIPDARIIPDISIASKGKVKTVLLVCAKKLEEVRSIAVDERSRTSVVLLKLILKTKGLDHIFFQPMPPDLDSMLKENDAALVIGDAAFGLDQIGSEVYDLSSLWYRLTKKPFVHAMIVALPGVRIPARVLEGLQEAKSSAHLRIPEIARQESQKLKISVGECADYLEHKIIYDLGPEEIEGLKEFFERSVNMRLINSSSTTLRFLEK